MKTLTVLSYAINGRGMGHLVRQLAILREARRLCGALGLRVEPWVLTSSEADTLARREGIPALKMPSKSMFRDAGIEPARYLAVARGWVLQTVAGLRPDLLLVDTFPGGTFGELAACLELAPRRALIARAVRPELAEIDAYAGLLPLYDRKIIPGDALLGLDPSGGGAEGAVSAAVPPILSRQREELPTRAAARASLGVAEGQRAVLLTLGGGGDPEARRLLPRMVDLLRNDGWHVVIAAGPLYDGPERRGPGITWLDRYLSLELLPGVDAAVCAGGYNSVHELLYCGVPMVLLPQRRIADDQGARAAAVEAAGAGRVAARPDEVPALLAALVDEGLDAVGARAAALIPTNGALEAAIQALSLVVPEDELRFAAAGLHPALLRSATGRALKPEQRLQLVELLSGDSPGRWRARRAEGLRLRDEGHPVGALPERPPPRGEVDPFLTLCDRTGAPAGLALSLLAELARRWPGLRGAALGEAAALLWPAIAQTDDWMGAYALLRTLPVERGAPARATLEALAAQIGAADDLYALQRAIHRTLDGDRRGLSEALATPPGAGEDLP
ncbi:MAG: hypothetical protein RL071_3960 [Pseudomonadota bacterium]